MTSYNEGDIIDESIAGLTSQGIDVFLVDNNSSDSTCLKASRFLAKGLIKVQVIEFLENGKPVYSWMELLKMKEKISCELDYDWYIHVDADEIRYPPWPNLNLSEAISRVDKAGYNLINFKLFDFRCTNLAGVPEKFEEGLQFYSTPEPYNQKQVKAWKRSSQIDLHSSGGHFAQVPNPKVFPVRFILKHYPLRNVAQAKKKILTDRKSRFATAERRMGWHVQYDGYESENDIARKLVWDKSVLTEFSLLHEQAELLAEGLDKIIGLGADATFVEMPPTDFLNAFLNSKRQQMGSDPDSAKRLTLLSDMLVACLTGNWKKVQTDVIQCRDQTMRTIYAQIGRIMYLRGDPLLAELLKTSPCGD